MPVSEASPAVAVERALNILEAAAQRRDGMTNSEISRKLAIPKSSASYILRTLERRGYLRREAETGRYRLGLKILSLGGDALFAACSPRRRRCGFGLCALADGDGLFPGHLWLFHLGIFLRGWPNETPRLRLHSLREFLDVAASWAEIVDGRFQFFGGIAKVLE